MSSSKTSKLSALASKYVAKVTGRVDMGAFRQKTQKYFKGNVQYYIMAGVLALIVLFLGYAVVSQLGGSIKGLTYTTETGSTAVLNLDMIKTDIYAFKTLDPNADEKSVKYNEILQKIALLETQGVWPEDVKKLKEMLNTDYERGFNIITIKSLTQFDDEPTGKRTQLLAFNETEKQKLGAPVSLTIAGQVNVAGEQAALIGAVNDSTRGSLVEYNIGGDAKGCSLSLSKK